MAYIQKVPTVTPLTLPPPPPPPPRDERLTQWKTEQNGKLLEDRVARYDPNKDPLVEVGGGALGSGWWVVVAMLQHGGIMMSHGCCL